MDIPQSKRRGMTLTAREKKNEKFKHVSLEMETSTHFPALMKCVSITDGTVIELGSGLFSTPLLHWMLFSHPERKLITCESYPHYLEFAKKFETSTHEVRFIKDWAKENFDTEVQTSGKKYSVVFIDHSIKNRAHTRGDDAIRFKDIAEYVVMHDAGKDAKPKYGYENAYKHFKYRYDWEGCIPHTTVLSNFHDLTDFYV